jgi:hypothetical protein
MTSGFRPRRESQAESSLVAALFIEPHDNNAGNFIEQGGKYYPSAASLRQRSDLAQ